MIIITIIILESAVQGWERVRTLYQSKDPNPWKKEKDKTVGDLYIYKIHWYTYEILGVV